MAAKKKPTATERATKRRRAEFNARKAERALAQLVRRAQAAAECVAAAAHQLNNALVTLQLDEEIEDALTDMIDASELLRDRATEARTAVRAEMAGPMALGAEIDQLRGGRAKKGKAL